MYISSASLNVWWSLGQWLSLVVPLFLGWRFLYKRQTSDKKDTTENISSAKKEFENQYEQINRELKLLSDAIIVIKQRNQERDSNGCVRAQELSTEVAVLKSESNQYKEQMMAIAEAVQNTSNTMQQVQLSLQAQMTVMERELQASIAELGNAVHARLDARIAEIIQRIDQSLHSRRKM